VSLIVFYSKDLSYNKKFFKIKHCILSKSVKVSAEKYKIFFIIITENLTVHGEG